MKNSKRFPMSFLFVVFMSWSICGHCAVLHVPSEYATIQQGIDAAIGGDIVLIADGTYTGEGNTNLDFMGKAITVKSEYGNSNCLIITANPEHGIGVYFHTLEGNASVVDGLSFGNGYPDRGSGIRIDPGTSPVIRNCLFTGMMANDYRGGAIYIDGASPVITQCEFSQNAASIFGGAIFCTGSALPEISRCIFTSNTADSDGSAICSSNASPIITNCTFRDNLVQYQSGTIAFLGTGSPVVSECSISGDNRDGIFCAGTTMPEITKCEIYENGSVGIESTFTAATVVDQCVIRNNGIGVVFQSEAMSVSNTRILNNHTIQNGGGVYCQSGASNPLTLFNCLISGNYASWYGGGMYIEGANVTIQNCTIVGNESGQEMGGGIFLQDANCVVSDTIHWNNTPSDIQIWGSSSCQADYSDIQQETGVYEGTGNINADPQFVNGPAGEYYLASNPISSPCIDTGSGDASTICISLSSGTVCMDDLTTNTENQLDSGQVDMGFHSEEVFSVPTCSNPSVFFTLIGLGIALRYRYKR